MIIIFPYFPYWSSQKAGGVHRMASDRRMWGLYTDFQRHWCGPSLFWCLRCLDQLSGRVWDCVPSVSGPRGKLRRWRTRPQVFFFAQTCRPFISPLRSRISRYSGRQMSHFVGTHHLKGCLYCFFTHGPKAVFSAAAANQENVLFPGKASAFPCFSDGLHNAPVPGVNLPRCISKRSRGCSTCGTHSGHQWGPGWCLPWDPICRSSCGRPALAPPQAHPALAGRTWCFQIWELLHVHQVQRWVDQWGLPISKCLCAFRSRKKHVSALLGVDPWRWLWNRIQQWLQRHKVGELLEVSTELRLSGDSELSAERLRLPRHRNGLSLEMSWLRYLSPFNILHLPGLGWFVGFLLELHRVKGLLERFPFSKLNRQWPVAVAWCVALHGELWYARSAYGPSLG